MRNPKKIWQYYVRCLKCNVLMETKDSKLSMQTIKRQHHLKECNRFPDFKAVPMNLPKPKYIGTVIQCAGDLTKGIDCEHFPEFKGTIFLSFICKCGHRTPSHPVTTNPLYRGSCTECKCTGYVDSGV